ncbi:MAG: L-serine ammonia-lyase, iron-sulfur-dependent, subunit alpha, partial [Candidatus Hodarchaeota archaeon]
VIALGTALAAQAAQGLVPQWVDSTVEHPSFYEIDPEEVISVTLQINDGLFKNSHATAIPNAGGHSGASKSAALGLFCRPEQKLNLFSNLEHNHIEKMKKVVAKSKITIETINIPSCNLFLHCKVTLRGEKGLVTGESCLQNGYTRVIFLKRNGVSIFNIASDSLLNAKEIELDISSLVQALQYLSIDAYHKLEETVLLNTQAYQYGLESAPGLGIGDKLDQLIQKGLMGDNVADLAASKTAAAEDVRMGGENLPVMGIASSGSHGITASIPIIAVAEKIQKDPKILLQSIALSFWITQKINALTGYLGVLCGCVIKAGIGATAGIAYYMGGAVPQIEQAINNYIVSTAGVICDGGKTTCSIKLANAASCAVQSAFLALEGVVLSDKTGGIVRGDVQKNIENMVRISKSMEKVDSVIVDILKGYQNE